MNALRVAYEATAPRIPGVGFDAFAAAFADADITPVCVNDECVGAILVKGCEVHACVMPHVRGRWVSRKLIKVLLDVVGKYGRAETVATTADGVEFVKRLGFVPVGNRWIMYGC